MPTQTWSTPVIEAHGVDEGLPRFALLQQHAPALGGEAVVPPAALAGLLDPLALQPAPFLEAVEQRIERGDVERHLARWTAPRSTC